MKTTYRLAVLLFGALLLAGTLLHRVVESIAHDFALLDASRAFAAAAPAGTARQFAGTQYFWGRPAAAGSSTASSGIDSSTERGRLPRVYSDTVQGRVAALVAADPGNKAPIPADLITASGVMLDPEISLASARYQVHRIATERGLAAQYLEALIIRHASKVPSSNLNQVRVNVMVLNQALDLGNRIQ